MKSRQRLLSSLAGGAAGIVVFAAACDRKEDEGQFAALEPPSLEFLSAENLDGDAFSPGDDIVVGCTPYLTLHLGPTGDIEGTILDWSLRPRGACGRLHQCGFIRVELLDDQGSTISASEQSVASLTLDLSQTELSAISELRATLIDGESKDPFEVDAAPVTATWETRIQSTCDGMGGAGGAGASTGGADGASPDPLGGGAGAQN